MQLSLSEIREMSRALRETRFIEFFDLTCQNQKERAASVMFNPASTVEQLKQCQAIGSAVEQFAVLIYMVSKWETMGKRELLSQMREFGVEVTDAEED